MDSIIGLLIVLIPVAFTLVGKKLEKAGEASAAATEDSPTMPEVFPAVEALMDEEEEPAQKEVPAVEEAVRVLPPKLPRKASVPYKAKDDDVISKKDPIDPKKLVIYSEIMKPKF